jgi:hypothetical protein
MSKLKCYTGNLDGLRRGLIVTTSKTKAAQIAGCRSYRYFNDYWSEVEIRNAEGLESDTLYTQPYNVYDKLWIKGRCDCFPLG